MRITASDLMTYWRPSLCELRVFLHEKGEPEAEPNPVLMPKQFAAFTLKRRGEIRPAYIHTPRNEHEVRLGYYRDVDITRLLRENRGKEKTIFYIARMMG